MGRDGADRVETWGLRCRRRLLMVDSMALRTGRRVLRGCRMAQAVVVEDCRTGNSRLHRAGRAIQLRRHRRLDLRNLLRRVDLAQGVLRNPTDITLVLNTIVSSPVPSRLRPLQRAGQLSIPIACGTSAVRRRRCRQTWPTMALAPLRRLPRQRLRAHEAVMLLREHRLARHPLLLRQVRNRHLSGSRGLEVVSWLTLTLRCKVRKERMGRV